MDFDEEQVVGGIFGLVCALVTLIVMKRVEGVGFFWMILGAIGGAVIGYLIGAKFATGG